jgi:hypothetical protein
VEDRDVLEHGRHVAGHVEQGPAQLEFGHGLTPR